MRKLKLNTPAALSPARSSSLLPSEMAPARPGSRSCRDVVGDGDKDEQALQPPMEGDSNTRFFHQKASGRNKKNKSLT